ncbi:MAG: hypothetical protein KDB27_19900 [Planctomycetales bacterium]|nr:hypothetical protein [Planctomycetales bacterium]
MSNLQNLSSCNASDCDGLESASSVAQRIASGALSSVEATHAIINRIQAVNARLNAASVCRFEEALEEAREADASKATPDRPLHGVPVTLKESFELAGTPATIGLTSRRANISKTDGPLAKSLRSAGAIIVAKTNVSMLMFSNETDNPVYGRTVNPWNTERTCGGSTGGEAALIAAGASILGFGGDMGGSIRVPCHFCGIHGIKPTNGRITRQGSIANIAGMKAFEFQPGPMARTVSDVALGLNVIAANRGATDAPKSVVPDYRDVSVSGLRIGIWPDDKLFPASPSIRRAINESAAALESAGAAVVEFAAPDFGEVVDLYMGLMSSDGGVGLRRLARGSEVNAGLKQLFRIGSIPRSVRPLISTALRISGQHRMARLLSNTGGRSAAEFWRLSSARNDCEAMFLHEMNAKQLDAIIFPPYALPAIRHGTATDLLMAGCYAYITNLVGLPAGVIGVTRVRPSEESDRAVTRELADRLARQAEEGSAGLPVGVQIAARHWREDVVLAIMAELEGQFCQRADFPLNVHQPNNP